MCLSRNVKPPFFHPAFIYMKNKFYVFVFLYALAPNSSAKNSQCSADEKIIFTCSSGKKTMSICSSQEDASSQYVEYRYATGSKNPSFTYRSDSNHLPNEFNRTSVLGASSESIIIWFKNSGHTYIVNDPIKGHASVSVWRSGRQIAENQCTGNYGGDSEASTPLIKQKTGDEYRYIFREKNN